MTNKTFTVAGVSTRNGVTKVRFANDMLYTKILAKDGHTDIDLVTLKNAMTKEDAIAALIAADFGGSNAATTGALQAAVDARAVVAPKAAKAVKSATKAPAKPAKKVPAKKAAPKKAVPAKAAVVETATEKALEDAPY